MGDKDKSWVTPKTLKDLDEGDKGYIEELMELKIYNDDYDGVYKGTKKTHDSTKLWETVSI